MLERREHSSWAERFNRSILCDVSTHSQSGVKEGHYYLPWNNIFVIPMSLMWFFLFTNLSKNYTTLRQFLEDKKEIQINWYKLMLKKKKNIDEKIQPKKNKEITRKDAETKRRCNRWYSLFIWAKQTLHYEEAFGKVN